MSLGGAGKVVLRAPRFPLKLRKGASKPVSIDTLERTLGKGKTGEGPAWESHSQSQSQIRLAIDWAHAN